LFAAAAAAAAPISNAFAVAGTSVVGRQAGRKGGRVLPSQSRRFALLYSRLE